MRNGEPRRPQSPRSDGASLSNVEVVTLAVFLCGGATGLIDTEDVAVKAAELSPGRFSWRKHKDQINLELIRVYLSDAKKSAHGSFLIGSGNKGWSLTPAGHAVAENLQIVLASRGIAHRPRRSLNPTWMKTERARLLKASAYKKFRSGRSDMISAADANSFFRLDDYVKGSLRKQKVTRLLETFSHDKELGPAVKAIAALLPET